jgi:hypothetical protein
MKIQREENEMKNLIFLMLLVIMSLYLIAINSIAIKSDASTLNMKRIDAYADSSYQTDNDDFDLDPPFDIVAYVSCVSETNCYAEADAYTNEGDTYQVYAGRYCYNGEYGGDEDDCDCNQSAGMTHAWVWAHVWGNGLSSYSHASAYLEVYW